MESSPRNASSRQSRRAATFTFVLAMLGATVGGVFAQPATVLEASRGDDAALYRQMCVQSRATVEITAAARAFWDPIDQVAIDAWLAAGNDFSGKGDHVALGNAIQAGRDANQTAWAAYRNRALSGILTPQEFEWFSRGNFCGEGTPW